MPRGNSDAGGVLAVIGIVVSIIVFLIRVTATYDVNVKGNASYCPRCNRQVSYRRNNCRSCGYAFVNFGSKPETEWSKAERLKEERDARLRLADRIKTEKIASAAKLEQARTDRDRRRAERREWYLARDVPPGPFAWVELFSLNLIKWYKNASDVTQMMLWSIGLAIPAGFIAYILFSKR